MSPCKGERMLYSKMKTILCSVVIDIVNIHHYYIMFMHGILQKMVLTINELNFKNTNAVVIVYTSIYINLYST